MPGLSVMVGGDSLYQGFGIATLQNDPFRIAACAISTPSLPVSVCKLACQGMSSAGFQANLQQMILAAPPNVAVMKGEGPNDLQRGTATAYAASLDGLISLGIWCASRGVHPVAATAMPYLESTSTDAAHRTFNARIRGSSWDYVDLDAAVSDGRSPAGIRAEFASFPRAASERRRRSRDRGKRPGRAAAHPVELEAVMELVLCSCFRQKSKTFFF